MSKFKFAFARALLLACLVPLANSQTTDTIGGPGYLEQYDNYVLWYPVTASSSGCLLTLGAYIGQDGNMRLALYSDNSGVPGLLLAQTADTPMSKGNSWQDLPVSPAGVVIAAGTQYWLAAQIYSSGPNSYLWYGGPSTVHYYLSQPYGPFPSSASGASLGGGPAAYLRMTYSPLNGCTSPSPLPSPFFPPGPPPTPCTSSLPVSPTSDVTLGACIGHDGDIILALYSDNGDPLNPAPGTLLAQTASTPMSPMSNFWQDLSVTPANVAVCSPGATDKYWVAVQVHTVGSSAYLWYGGSLANFYWLSAPYDPVNGFPGFPLTTSGLTLGTGYGPYANLRLRYSPDTINWDIFTIGGTNYLAQHDNYMFWYQITVTCP